MKKTVRKFFVLILIVIFVSACNLPASTPSPEVKGEFAKVYIAKPGANFQKWADLNISAAQTVEGSTEFFVDLQITDANKSNLTVAYILTCDRQTSAQTGHFLAGQAKISCLGDEFELYVNNTLAMEAKIIDGVVHNIPETVSIVLGNDIVP